MALAQINLRIEQGLLAQMKAEAKLRGLSLNSLAASAFERLLAGEKAAEASSNKLDGLEDVLRRLEQLEQKVAKQSQQAHHLPHGPAPAVAPAKPAADPPSKPKQIAQLGEDKPMETLPNRRLTLDEAKGLLTNREICKTLGLSSESSLTNWIARNGHDKAVGLVFKREFRLLGKGLLPGGTGEVWLWRQV